MDESVHKIDKEDLVDYIIQNNFAITPNGMVFRTDEVSVICEVLQDWLDKRDLYKSKMKQSRKELDFDMASFYDNYQMVFKTFANSIYGCLALHFFRYTTEEKYLSTAITVSGQFATRNTIKHIDNRYNKFMGTKDYKYVNYSDTDSFYVECFPMVKKILGYDVDKNENDIIIPIVEKISEEIMEDCNLFYNVLLKENMNLDKHFLQLKPEYIIKRGYWSKKKKYACYLVRKEGTPIKEGSEYDFKGLDIVKSNFNKSFKKLSKGLIIDILNGAEREDISEKILDFKDWTITCDYDDLSLPVGIKQPLEKYVDREAMKGQIFSKTTKGALSQFKASIRFNDFIKFYGLSKTHTEISIGESVKYVYLKNNPLGIDSLSYKYGEQNPQKVLDFIERYIDRNKNFDKQLLKKLQTIYDSLSWGEINLNRNKTKILKK
jgi:DNA polymerase elongation subunit (family B)